MTPERISQIPTHADQDVVFFKAVSFEINHAGNLGGVHRALGLQ